MNKLHQLLRSSRGETLVESLVSVLVFTLSSLLLFSMVFAAANINRSAKQADLDRQEQLSAAETGDGETVPGTVTVLIGSEVIPSESFNDISICRKEPGALYSYFRSAPDPEGLES